MGTFFSEIQENHQRFIEKQHMFFVATAPESGKINLSPKGIDNTFHVLGPNRVMWLNLTGSGNESAAHLHYDDRITMMFCAFEGPALILRLYGKAKVYHPRDPEYAAHIDKFPDMVGSRQIIDVEVDSVLTSCGTAVPYYAYEKQRTQLTKWADKKGRDGVEKYWEEKNQLSFDGKETGILG